MSKKTIVYVSTLLALTACTANNYELSAREKAEREMECQEMKKEIQELRGRPIRRTEVRRQYELECASDF